jgi:hypothetical protein
MTTPMMPHPSRPVSSVRPVVAVTGADGFIGSHLTEQLVEAGYRVKAMAIYNSQGSYGWLDTVPQTSCSTSRCSSETCAIRAVCGR